MDSIDCFVSATDKPVTASIRSISVLLLAIL